jgi:hypothetical protein
VKRRRRGSAVLEYLLVTCVLGLGTAGALVKAGADLHREYQADRRAIASPLP